MNIEVIQDSIVAQIQASFTAGSLAFTAQRLPESDAEYKKAVQSPICFVAYTGSTSPGVKNTNPTSQDRKLQFSIQVIGLLLYNANGLHNAGDYVEKSIIGFRPTNCDRIYLVKDESTRGEDKLWTREFQVEAMTVLVQDSLSEPIVVPSLQRVDVKFQNAGNPLDADNGQTDQNITN
jgi:hypothetical protein